MAASSTGQRLRSASGKLWEACIGLEVHAQIQLQGKLFSGAPAQLGGFAKANSQVALVDAALPGTLPTLNHEAVTQAIRTGLALGCKIHPVSRFERKHYYYCDLPQGYQITQQASPIATGGALRIEPPIHENQRQKKPPSQSQPKKKNNANTTPLLQPETHSDNWAAKDVRITRIQLEQDSGKSTHSPREGHTLVDLNRAGTALMEIVFEPDLSSPTEAAELLRTLQATLRQLGTCDGNMDEGSMRCDLNVSVRPVMSTDNETKGKDNGTISSPSSSPSPPPPSSSFPSSPSPPPFSPPSWGPRAEIKNMNSIKFLQQAATYEITRQITALEQGETLQGETRSFNPATGTTKRMRAKEGAVDYRFFPEPDLPPLVLDQELITHIHTTLPELPQAMRGRLVGEYGLSLYQACVLVGEGEEGVAFFERIAKGGKREGKNVANWICNDLFGLLKAKVGGAGGGGGGGGEGGDGMCLLQSCPVTSEGLGEVIDLVNEGKISIRTGKEVLALMVEEKEEEHVKGKSPSTIVTERGWEQMSDETQLRALATKLVSDPASARQLRQYKEGKLQMLKYFVGQAMKETGGRAAPELMEAFLKEELAK